MKHLLPQSARLRISAFCAPRPGEEVDQLGVPIRLHYAFTSVASFVMSVIPLAISFTPAGAELASPFVRGMCVVGIFLIWGYWAYGKSIGFRRDLPFYHFATFMGIAAVGVCAIYIGELRSPLAAAILSTPMIAGYFLSFRESFVHIIYAVGIMILVGAHFEEPDAVLRTSVLVIVMLTGWLVVTTTKNRLFRALEEHRELSETDPLTGAANIRRLETLLNNEIDRSNRGGQGFSIIEFDLDEFKQTNDRYSHSVGDRVLLSTADAVRAELSAGDVLVRRGGDEFTIVAPHGAGRDIDRLCDRIRLAIEDARAAHCPDISATASVGWTAHHRGETAKQLVMRADEEVKRAKSRSRAEKEAGKRKASVSNSGAQNRVEHLTLVDESDTNRNRHAPYIPRSAPTDPIAVATSFAWKQAAALFIVVNLAFGVIVVTGQSSIEPDLMYLAMTVVGVALAGVCWWISKSEKTPKVMTHVLAIGTLVVIVASLSGRGTAAAAGAEIFLVAILFQMYLLPTKTAAAYAVVTMVLFAAMLSLNGYAEVGLRVNSALNTMVLISIVLAFSRRRTIEFAVENAELAGTDALTGLANMRSLRTRLDDEIARSSTLGSPLSLVMLDLDDFKKVNDLYGHSRGDNVLASVANALKNKVRRSELPARRGGDEFAVILTDASEHEAEMALARFGVAIEQARSSLCEGVIPTASLGYATWKVGDSTDDLFERADASLHDAKARSHSSRFHALEALENVSA